MSMTDHRQIEAAAAAIAAVWESHGAGYLAPGLFEAMAKAALQAAEEVSHGRAPAHIGETSGTRD